MVKFTALFGAIVATVGVSATPLLADSGGVSGYSLGKNEVRVIEEKRRIGNRLIRTYRFDDRKTSYGTVPTTRLPGEKRVGGSARPRNQVVIERVGPIITDVDGQVYYDGHYGAKRSHGQPSVVVRPRNRQWPKAKIITLD